MKALSLPNFHLITAKYIPESNSRGERIKISSFRFRESITINHDWDYSVWENAKMWLQKKGFEIIGKGEGKTEWIFISTTFNPLK